jgi:hypothetical protein
MLEPDGDKEESVRDLRYCSREGVLRPYATMLSTCLVPNTVSYGGFVDCEYN